MGGAVGFLASRLLVAVNRPAVRGAAVAVFVPVAPWLSVVGAGEALRLRDRHLAVDAWAAAQAIGDLEPAADGIVVARKPHVGFCADLKRAGFPLAQDMDQLVAAGDEAGGWELCEVLDGRPATSVTSPAEE